MMTSLRDTFAEIRGTSFVVGKFGNTRDLVSGISIENLGFLEDIGYKVL
ncbi:MAG: hypothetical protein HC780_22395 [Leptolyngbyaceae cyanobacterium CSU_1_3]|nr:hypothetical protein [Leptolyngbyaceae cyanobacterium CSU_1_3]